MKRPDPRHSLASLLDAVRRRRRRERQPTSAFEEMGRGSAVGMPAAALIALGLGAPNTVLVWAGFFGVCTGALIGLLLWIGADGGHEDPVVQPPRRERKERSKED